MRYKCPNCGNDQYSILELQDRITAICNECGYVEDLALKPKQDIVSQEPKQEVNIPKCPTCGSTNIEKISLSKKAIGGAMFGLFSSNVRKTMYCKNCGYKW